MARTAPRTFSTIEDTGDLKPCHNSTRKFVCRLCYLTPFYFVYAPHSSAPVQYRKMNHTMYLIKGNLYSICIFIVHMHVHIHTVHALPVKLSRSWPVCMMVRFGVVGRPWICRHSSWPRCRGLWWLPAQGPVEDSASLILRRTHQHMIEVHIHVYRCVIVALYCS